MATVLKNTEEPARSFYRERLGEAFALSHKLSGYGAEEAVDTPEFDRILLEYGLGSLDSARRIGEMVVIHLDKASSLDSQPQPTLTLGWPIAWWRDLLNFARGRFLQMATTQQAPPCNRWRRGVSALCMTFEWNVPEIAKRLGSGQPATSAAEDLRRKLMLLFARNQEGKVTVVEAGPAVERVFRATNSLRTLEQIAETAGMPLPDTQRVLAALASVGAVIPAKTAEEMLQTIRVRKEGK